MLTIREIGLLRSIVKYCDKIENKTAFLTRKQFDEDEDLREIICFNIFQIGETAKSFDADFIKKYNGVPWSQIKGMRDKIGHGYGAIDLDKIWKTAIRDIKPLNEYCKKILAENDDK